MVVQFLAGERSVCPKVGFFLGVLFGQDKLSFLVFSLGRFVFLVCCFLLVSKEVVI